VSDLRRVSGWFHVSFLLVALMMAVMGSMPQVVNAQEGNVLLSAWTTNPAIIDGTMVSYVGEWDDANYYTITFYDDDTPAGTAELWLKNDADNLYMLWQGSYDDLLTVTYLYFDPENNGVLTPNGEDAKYASDTVSFSDGYWDGEDWSLDVPDGEQTTGLFDSTTFREVRIPLDSGDPHDMSVEPGDTIGVMFARVDGSWPEDAFYQDASTWGDMLIAGPPQDTVDTATGTGTATFQTNLGGIVDLTAIGEDDLPQDAQDSMPNANFPHGFFTFRIVGIPAGSTVTITITLPDPVTADTEYWKWGPEPSDLTDHWYQIPIDAIDGNTITITLTDNGLGDDVLTGTDEMIIDQGGPGKPNPEEKPTPVGGEVYQTDKLMLLTPHIATIVALATTAIIVKKRRH